MIAPHIHEKMRFFREKEGLMVKKRNILRRIRIGVEICCVRVFPAVLARFYHHHYHRIHRHYHHIDLKNFQTYLLVCFLSIL